MDNNLVINGKLMLYGYVGDTYWDDGFTSSQVVRALASLSGPLDVHVNSGGGIAFEGVAIYQALRAYSSVHGAVTVHIDAIAASAASVIAMAGDEIVMPEGAMMMIHNASAITMGTKDDHEKSAAALGKIDASMAQLYASRTGQDEGAVQAMMDEETWLTGTEAVEKGFATRTEASAAASPAMFNYSLYSKAPADLRALASQHAWQGVKLAAPSAANPVKKETSMTVKNPAADDGNTAVIEAATAEAVTKATASERHRVSEIRKITAAHKSLPADLADTLIDGGVTLADARVKVLEALAAAQPDAKEPQYNTRVTHEAVDRFAAGATASLLAKAGMGGERNEYSSYSLSELARASLDARGLRPRSPNRLEMVGAAFVPTMAGGMHSTSDFGNILLDVANKSMLKGWEEAEETFDVWTSKGQASDFKPINRVDANLFPALAKIEEGAEYTYATIGDRKAVVQVATYGKMFSITRQAIINDDLSVFTGIPRKMGRASKRTIGNLVYAVLTSNPNMGDGVALFHTATHGNLAAAGGAPSMTTLDAARTAMALQKDPDAAAVGGLNIRPAYVLAPVTQQGKLAALLAAEFDPAGTQRNPNIVRNMAQLVTDARLDTASTLSWYVAASPASTDTIEVTYLDGVEAPFMEQKDGWSIDGTEFKVRIDAGVTPLDHRGLYKNPGA
ncbi:MAG: Clp protease ClpP [Hyphomicrobiaceae bacterium]|nr:MAG: Clp protease ClpP [Hyphomicrobiaceae bacterium]